MSDEIADLLVKDTEIKEGDRVLVVNEKKCELL